MPMLDKTLNTVIMPFRLKLKRTGRYILSYKNSFLVSLIELAAFFPLRFFRLRIAEMVIY